MTKFEIRYGTRTLEVERKERTLETFVEFLSSCFWYIIEDEGVAIQTSLINSVKEVE